MEGGKYYEFTVLQRTKNLKFGRRTAVTRVLWRDADGSSVNHDFVSVASYARGTQPRAEPEFPAMVEELENGWSLIKGTYLVPSAATQGIVELSLKSILFRRDYLRNLSDLREITDDCRRSVYFPKIRRKN